MVVQSEIKSDERSKIVAQEISFAKVLAGNDKKRRDQGVKKLKRWLTYKLHSDNVFTEEDFKTIWTGLFYAMYMSDKPLIQKFITFDISFNKLVGRELIIKKLPQLSETLPTLVKIAIEEEVAESLSHLIHCFSKHEDLALLFIKSFYVTVTQAWAGIDQHRIDKYSMLLRRFLRQCLEFCAESNWETKRVKKLMKLFSEVVLSRSTPFGISYHFIDIFLEELSKVSKGELRTTTITRVLAPFIRLAAITPDIRIRKQLHLFFNHLISQTDAAFDYEEKFEAWKKAGYPGGDLNNVVIESDSEGEIDEGGEEAQANENDGSDEEEENLLEMQQASDPRAGKVHVVLPQIPVPSKSIIFVLKKTLARQDSTLKGRKMIKALIRRFTNLKKGKYPLGLTKVPKPKKAIKGRHVKKCAKKLIRDSMSKKATLKMMKEKLKRLNAELLADMDNVNVVTDNAIKDIDEESIEKTKETHPDIERNKTMNGAENINCEISSKKAKKRKSFGKNDECEKIDVTPLEKGAEVSDNKTILQAVNLVQAKKRKSLTKELEVGINEGLPSKLNNRIDSDTPKRLPKTANGLTALEESNLEVNGDKENTGLENVKVVSTPKRRKRDDGTYTQKDDAKALKKRKSLSNWIVDEVDPKKPISPPKLITIEKKDPFALIEGRNKHDESSDESETEIAVPNRRHSHKSPGVIFWQTAMAKVEASKSPVTPTSLSIKNLRESTSGRRISFNLSMNRFQEKQEYLDELQKSPQIPFDSLKKPTHSALKPGLAPSPVNPFYKRRKL